MKNKAVIFLSFLLVIILCACNMPQPVSNGPESAIQVAATLTQIALSAPQASPTAEAPTLTETPLASPTITTTPAELPGSLDGTIGNYPYGPLPSLVIVAVNQQDSRYYSYLTTDPGSTYYSMSGDYLIPGIWLVVAYDKSGNSGGCTTTVTITSDQVTTCDISDWTSAYPPKRADVPSPQ